ncbi:MAG: DNA mismatch repair protein MutS [Candidatus Hermodarchaeota archaeon]
MSTRSKTKKTTPMMQKWYEFKKEYPNAILFYQVGDFYETFHEDAELVSKELGLTLTARGTKERIPLAGVPIRSIETYITRLVKKGYKVIQIDQTEDAKKAKGPIVARGITRIVTAGTAISGDLVPDRANNYLIAIDEARGRAGLVIADISTGEFLATQLEGSTKEEVRKQLLDELSRYRPSECVLSSSLYEDKSFCEQLKNYVEDLVLSPYDDRAFLFETAEHRLLEHFKTLSLDGFGCADRPLVVSAAGAALAYLQENQKEQLSNIQSLRVYQVSEYMHLDTTTERNLELVRNTRDNSQRGTLLAVLDHTVTNMGGRLLRRWILHPLLDVIEIQKRLDSVEELVDNSLLREEIRDYFNQVSDLQRLISKISYGSANARDVLAIKVSLEKANEIKNLLPNTQTPYLQEIYSGIEILSSLIELIDQAIVDDPPIAIKEGGMIKRGYNAELDELHTISSGGKEYLLKLEEREKQQTGIPSLKVGFNSVFGYYIEVTNTHKNKVPNHYVRKQTLTNRERYITDELKEFEEKILNAQDKIFELEYTLFNDIRLKIKDEIRAIQKNAELLATLDVLCTFAWIAPSYQYIKPKVNDSTTILIRNGRHPVVEAFQNEPFIPNDTLLDTDENQFLIITGPNMAGKSTYLRQVALITLLTQIGCFVPATSAEIGIVDRIFTRIGAYDVIAEQKSTFMVEMTETAEILHNATQKSLILLDEVGRGTSTFDGLSIAWAVTEYLHALGPRTLFATHYHQLTELEQVLSNLKNYHVEVLEQKGEMIFIRKIRSGGTNRSYGIQVAALAGLPQKVINRAIEVLAELEEREILVQGKELDLAKGAAKRKQTSLFDWVAAKNHPVIDEILRIDLQNMTPLEALNKLHEIKTKVKDIEAKSR